MKKRVFVLLLIALLAIMLSGCGKSGAAPTESAGEEAPPAEISADEAPVGEAAAAEMNEWAQSANLDKTESAEELYELAKKEGKVVIYSISSRMKKVKESFEAQYPGVTVEVYDISTNELLEKITREYEAGVRTADVIHIKDQDGSLYIEYVKNNILHNYQPEDITAHIAPDLLRTQMPFYLELTEWFYNDEAYPDGPPISSWWDLTKPEWKGKILMANPLDNLSYMSVLTGLVLDADALAEDYKRVFGEEIQLDGTENAGYELIKRLVANDLVFMSSSSEMVEAVGTRGQENPPIAYASSSKMRERAEKDFAIQVVSDILPHTGIPALNTVYVVNECPHPNAAKLLIRWMLGEADGKGEGFVPFNTIGGWPIRDDVELVEGAVPLSEVNVQDFDADAIYHKIQEVNDFWISIQK